MRNLMLMFLLLKFAILFEMKNTENNINVSVIPHPIEFLKDVDLICEILTEKKIPEIKIWSRIPNGQTLAVNNLTTNSSKYVAKVKNMEHKIIYSLTILKFDESDLDLTYRCDYEFSSYSKYLGLNERDFIAMPSEDRILKTVQKVGTDLQVNITIFNVYPAPSCSITFGDENLTDKLVVNNEKYLLFFRTRLELNTRAKMCNGQMIITCLLGKKELNITGAIKSTLCEETATDDGLGKKLLIIIAVLCASLVVLFIACVATQITKRKHKSKQYSFDKMDIEREPKQIFTVKNNQNEERQ